MSDNKVPKLHRDAADRLVKHCIGNHRRKSEAMTNENFLETMGMLIYALSANPDRVFKSNLIINLIGLCLEYIPPLQFQGEVLALMSGINERRIKSLKEEKGEQK